MSADQRTLEVTLRSTPTRGGFTLDVHFQVPPGLTILFGPSGSGKSTTLAAIAGLARVGEGKITLGSEVWLDSRAGIERPIHQRGVAFVFQSLALFPHMTAQANVMYGIDRKLPDSVRRARARTMLERMRVSHVAERRPGTLSGGEAQRVALARAFASEPKLALLDEPFSALDRDLRRELCADVRTTVAEARIPAILVTHHRNEARALGDRIVTIAGGRIVASGTLDELLPRASSARDADAAANDAEADEAFDGTPMPELRPMPKRPA